MVSYSRAFIFHVNNKIINVPKMVEGCQTVAILFVLAILCIINCKVIGLWFNEKYIYGSWYSKKDDDYKNDILHPLR